MNILLILGSVLLTGITHFILTWVLYLAIMNLYRAQNTVPLTFIAKVIGTEILITGLILDVLGNFIWCTLLFAQTPLITYEQVDKWYKYKLNIEWLITARLSRYKRTTTGGYRYKLATWLCVNLLDPFDPSGCHCKD